jgi:hypothetical protein
MTQDRWLVVCHDAGGAEVVSSWVRANPNKKYSFCIGGPAKEIFFRKLGAFALFDLNQDWNFDFLLTSTSWASDMELRALQIAKDKGTRSASYLDHWSTYDERFGAKGHEIYPDEVWVGDHYALEIAQRIFPNLKVIEKKNYYLEEINERILDLQKNIGPHEELRILYVSEPISDAVYKKYGDRNYYGYSEFDAISGFFSYLENAKEKKSIVRIRLHPSEPDNKYSALCVTVQDKFQLEISKAKLLEDDCAWADWVVGCQSMAMVIALRAGKKVFSSIPSHGRKSLIPHREIISLFR